MSTEARIVAFEGGRLRALEPGASGREAVLALPLNRLLVRLVRVPSGADPVETALPVLKAASPYPDEELTVSCEAVREDESGQVMIAAALPERSADDDLGEALDAAKLSVVRIDSLALGQLRGVWNALGESNQRRLVLLDSVDCLSLFVLDGDQPTAIRAVTDRADLRREVTLTLLAAEDFGGPSPLTEIVVVESDVSDTGDSDKSDTSDLRDERPQGDSDKSDTSDLRDERPQGDSDKSDTSDLRDERRSLVAQVPQVPQVKEILPSDFALLADFAPVRTVTVGADVALAGVAERAKEAAALNALPASWRELLEETRFKSKLVTFLSIAGGLWLLVMAVLFGVPMGYEFMTGREKEQSRQHARQYRAVKEMKEKVDVVRKYSDHARGALEIMKAVSDRLPEGVTLSSWSYRRDEGVRVTGETPVKDETYALKDTIEALTAGEGEAAEPIFGRVDLSGVTAAKGGFRFTLDCLYEKEEEE